jgi:hypothetical protein
MTITKNCRICNALIDFDYKSDQWTDHKTSKRHVEPDMVSSEPNIMETVSSLRQENKHIENLLMEIGNKIDSIISDHEHQYIELKKRISNCIWSLKRFVERRSEIGAYNVRSFEWEELGSVA